MPGLAARNTDECPVLRPSKAQFNKPFLTFVSDYFKKNPDVPVIKVVPPKGYRPRQSGYNQDDTMIEVPIEQRVGCGWMPTRCLQLSVRAVYLLCRCSCTTTNPATMTACFSPDRYAQKLSHVQCRAFERMLTATCSMFMRPVIRRV